MPAPTAETDQLPSAGEAEPDDDQPFPSYGRDDTDTAALMRELSSLGLEDAPTPAPVRPPPAARPIAPAPPKKRKGLFGR